MAIRHCDTLTEEIAGVVRAARTEGEKAARAAIDVRGLSDDAARRVEAAMIDARNRMHPVGSSALAVFARLFCDAERRAT